jgi:hypothetical protein
MCHLIAGVNCWLVIEKHLTYKPKYSMAYFNETMALAGAKHKENMCTSFI